MQLLQAQKTLVNPKGFCNEMIDLAKKTIAEAEAKVVEEPVVEEPTIPPIPE